MEINDQPQSKSRMNTVATTARPDAREQHREISNAMWSLWREAAAIWNVRFTNPNGKKPDSAWQRRLKMYEPEHIAAGFQAYVDKATGWPPTLDELVYLVKHSQHPPAAYKRKQKALPRPPSDGRARNDCMRALRARGHKTTRDPDEHETEAIG